MKVTTRLTAGSALVLLMLLGVMGYQVWQVSRLVAVTRELSVSGLEAARLSLEQIHDLDELERTARKYYITRDSDYGDMARRLGGRVSESLARLEALPLSPRLRQETERMAVQWKPIAGTLESGLENASEEALLGRIEAVRGQSASVMDASQRAMQEEAARAERASRHATTISVLVACLALLISAAVLALTVQSIQAPLRRLAEATHAVAKGRFDVRLRPDGGDEFARLAADFDSMVGRLGELDRMKKEILSHVSHELKTPLAAMQEADQLLLERVSGPLTEDQERLLAMNLQSARRLSAMIAKLLDLARMEAGVMDYDLQPRNLFALTRDAAAQMELRARERGVELRVCLSDHSPWARCDGDRIFQVVENLIENALKFSPAGSVVGVDGLLTKAVPDRGVGASVPRPGAQEWAVIRVSDRGPGVAPEEKVRIFERFHQVGPSGRRAGGGVGLGLAICREILESHGGPIWVEDHPGGGSLFCFALKTVPPSDNLTIG